MPLRLALHIAQAVAARDGGGVEAATVVTDFQAKPAALGVQEDAHVRSAAVFGGVVDGFFEKQVQLLALLGAQREISGVGVGVKMRAGAPGFQHFDGERFHPLQQRFAGNLLAAHGPDDIADMIQRFLRLVWWWSWLSALSARMSFRASSTSFCKSSAMRCRNW